MKICMTKVHGSENEFFLIDETLLNRKLTPQEIEKIRISLCDREQGLLQGADGLLLIEQATSDCSLAKMCVINQDGSEASMCGNGLRTVARYLSEKESQEVFYVETKYANLKVSQSANIGQGVQTYKVEISPVVFDIKAVPMNFEKQQVINEIVPELSQYIRFSVVSVPNPHLIAFVDHETLYSDEFEQIATYVNEKNDLFPDGINVSFVEVLADKKIFVRTFERGVGFTNACGTAMCASSLMHSLLHTSIYDEEITVLNPGGMVKTIVHIKSQENYWIELIGNATFTHKIEGKLTAIYERNFDSLKIEETTEHKKYLEFLKTLTSDELSEKQQFI